jgi:predicted kinase
MLNRSEFTKDNEEQIGRVRSYLVRTYLESGYSVIVDNTNLNPRHEEEMRDLASALMVDFEIKEFPVDVETCIERDKKRANPVGKSVIEDMAKRWNYYPPKPREFEPIVQDQSLPRAFVFDID